MAVIYEGERVPDSDTPRFLDALRDRVAERTGLRVLRAAAVERAVALRADHRIRPGGPRCGQLPALAWVLTSQHANLVIAEAFTGCPAMPPEGVDDCRFEVRFRRPGTDDTAGLPDPLFAPARPGGDPEAWIAAAAQLADREVPLSGFVGVWRQPVPVEVRAIGAAETDPWLRIPRLLSESNAAFDECTPPDESDARSFDVSWRVSATGETSDVVVRPRRNADEEVAACVQRALEGLSWPCTPANRSQRVELTLCLGRPDVYPFGDGG